MKVKAIEMTGAEAAAQEKLLNDLGMVKVRGMKDWLKKGQKCKEQAIIECVRQAVNAHNQKIYPVQNQGKIWLKTGRIW